ncbi:MAG: lipoyl(octanoyl) transferase LipB [Bacteroidales bacterium]|nr:lipoyl(octanoyl) transferase LipB [Bacteroidales bacterium]MCF8403667.1 lipoyl(octanoyl) transferase LipB [Bacteroidales bacterium]
MEQKVIFKDLGTLEYAKAWDLQKKLLGQVQEIKVYNHSLPACEQSINYNYLLFCEHPHVYTLGKSGNDNNLLVNENFLKEKGASFFKIDRGGDITYHGPGQIVGYPILDLEAHGLGVKQYVYKIEEAIIKTLEKYGIAPERLEGATGVWLDTKIPGKTRKICAIGVKVSRYVTMHGFAFNVNTNLEYYNYINPCGFIDKGVTSMQKELGKKINFEEVKENLKEQFAQVFAYEYVLLNEG